MFKIYKYGKGKFESDLTRHALYEALRDKDCLVWADLEAATDFEEDSLVEIFNFHPLAVEDCINDISQPKVDDYEEYLFLVVHALESSPGEGLQKRELDLFLGSNFVVTVHKDPVAVVADLRLQIEKKPESLMGQGADLLIHAILDRIVDSCLPALEEYEERIDELEEQTLNQPGPECLSSLTKMRRDIFEFRRTIAPQRDTLNALSRISSPFIREQNRMYFRDVYDHLFQIYGSIEGLHEVMAGLAQVYFSHSSHKLNEVVKRMTVLATLTMPTVLIASIYGMNFRNMPELEHPYGYFGALFLMVATSCGMLGWMKWKKWI